MSKLIIAEDGQVVRLYDDGTARVHIGTPRELADASITCARSFLDGWEPIPVHYANESERIRSAISQLNGALEFLAIIPDAAPDIEAAP